MRFASIRHDGAVVGVVVADDAAYLLPHGLSVGDLVALGLERALEHGRTAVRGKPVPFGPDQLELPYVPPSVRDFVTFESHVEGVRRSVDGASGVPTALASCTSAGAPSTGSVPSSSR